MIKTSTLYDELSPKLAGGEPLAASDLDRLAETHDIISLGALADELRRRIHGARVTYVRVAPLRIEDAREGAGVPPAAREVRLTGVASSIDEATDAVRAARGAAAGRTVSGFNVADLAVLAEREGQPLHELLRRLHGAGLENVSEVPLDRLPEAEAAIDAMLAAGFTRVRLTLQKAVAADDRLALVRRAAALRARYAEVRTLNPLPMTIDALRPTTGYDDVKIVALARLATPALLSVQVDWLRYGPKLAQVALTFGADDLDNVTAGDEAPEGRRRAPLEEVRRNIQAAGFEPAERDGRFEVITG